MSDDDAPHAPADELTALLAHELRNLFATIATSAAAAGLDPNQAERFLRRIGDTAQTGQRLVDEIMALGQLAHLQRETVELAEVLATARATLELPATFEDENTDLALDAHPALLARLFHALYSNAAAVGAGGSQPPHVLTRASCQGETVVVEVQDDGPGVPPSLREHLFAPFRTARPGGTGLGLTLARRVAEAHGGQLSLRADTERTTFRLVIPRGVQHRSPTSR